MVVVKIVFIIKMDTEPKTSYCLVLLGIIVRRLEVIKARNCIILTNLIKLIRKRRLAAEKKARSLLNMLKGN